ncbi:phospholipid scramblase 2-like isoform X1 [Homalodisca vitripennis]|uniref:phospholipid scramblase 2-like isoform X1 n=1 Tax=Homalodisca vitripennis TaxID=197043 RepID=UPI001EE9BD82|nr:phospholipid scramblase 2-like isoform X1 [Homalodisca vitripennis]
MAEPGKQHQQEGVYRQLDPDQRSQNINTFSMPLTSTQPLTVEQPPLLQEFRQEDPDLKSQDINELPISTQPLPTILQVSQQEDVDLKSQDISVPPISTQPLPTVQPHLLQDDWNSLPMQVQNSYCPPGLEYLTSVDQLLVHQKVELCEALIGYETCNKFVIKNSLGQQVFYAAEESDCCSRNFCGPLREFRMTILDNFNQEVMSMDRPFGCGPCCFPCCLQEIKVYAPPGCLAGTVKQNWTLWKPSFQIKNAEGETVLTIEGPCWMCSCYHDVNYKVLSNEKEIVGKITKQWGGLLREAFTDSDNFCISFPMDLDVRIKAVMLGACVLIDMMYYESPNNSALS